MNLVLVAAVARDGAIGRGNRLLFTDPADQRHFRAVTTGHPVLMGRRTWLSVPDRFRPLPGRRNVVLSRDPGFIAPGAEVLPSLPAALALLAGVARVCVIGGAAVYAEALPLADELLLTEVDRRYDGADTYFPPWNRDDFIEVAREPHRAEDDTAFAFVTYRRKAVGGG